MQKSKLESNALIIFGGGLVDPAKYILMRIAMNLSTIYSKVFIGKYSFESLYTPEYMCFYDKNLIFQYTDTILNLKSILTPETLKDDKLVYYINGKSKNVFTDWEIRELD